MYLTRGARKALAKLDPSRREALTDGFRHVGRKVLSSAEQPLTVILAQTQLIHRQLARGETLAADQLATRVALIFGAATRMRGPTRDLLDASLQQAGRPLALLLARTELVALTRQAVGEHQLVSAVHQFLFEAEVPVREATVDELVCSASSPTCWQTPSSTAHTAVQSASR